MKSILRCSILLIAVGLLVTFSTDANAQLIKEVRFAAEEGYTEGPLLGQPAGADNVWQEGNEGAEGNRDEIWVVSDGKLVITQDGQGSAIWGYIEFPEQLEGMITVTWEWQYFGPEDGTVDIGLCISDTANFENDGNPALNWPEQSAMSRMQQNDGVIDVRDGDWFGEGDYAAFEEFPYADGILVYERFEIDLDNQTYDVYVQKEGQDEVMLADDFGFRYELIEGLNAVTMWVNGADLGTGAIVDNIVIAGPASVNDWALH